MKSEYAVPIDTEQEQRQQETRLEKFREENSDLFEKNDLALYAHLGMVLTLLAGLTTWVIATPEVWLKIPLVCVSVLLWFALINVTIHHHHTHHNAAKSRFAQGLLNLLYLLVLPNAPKRKSRYVRAHLNHHARPFHETDVDHHHGTNRYLALSRSLAGKIFYFLELTSVGAHVPGWQDDAYMNQVPLENWTRGDYEKVKEEERKEALKRAAFHWLLFLLGAWWIPPLAWGWGLPMLLVKNWAHYLGQFQHYDARFLNSSGTGLEKTKSFHVPAWLNYLSGGEISGHFLHHLFPELPYYKIEAARQRFLRDAYLSQTFVYY